MVDQNEEICNTIRRVMLALIFFALFCLATLSKSDMAMFKTEGIMLPFAQTHVAYIAFLYVAPLILIGLTLYLHIYIERHYERRITNMSVCPPHLFNFRDPISTKITWFLFYGLPPLLIVLFFIKAKPHPWSSGLLVLAFLTAIVLILASHHRKDSGPQKKDSGSLSYAVAVTFFKKLLIPTLIVGAIVLAKSTDRKIEFHNEKLYNIKLSKYNLPNSRFTCTSEPNCRNAIVECKFDEADLTGAVFKNVTLKRVEFNAAQLQNVTFENVTLEEVTFNTAQLQNAVFKNVSLKKKVSFDNTQLQGARFSVEIDVKTGNFSEEIDLKAVVDFHNKWNRISSLN